MNTLLKKTNINVNITNMHVKNPTIIKNNELSCNKYSILILQQRSQQKLSASQK